MQHVSKTAEQILPQMNLPFDWQTAVITQFRHEEDGEPYQVWKIQTCKEAYILKEAKGYEAEVYTSLLPHLNSVPQVYQITVIEDTTYLLMEYVEGQDLRRCTRPALTLALDALIQIQQATWNNQALAYIGYSFEESLPHRKKRGTYLQDAQLEAAYDRFLSLYARLPRTLCHDDLLPFNVLVSPDRAVLIDWEYAGLLPYPTSFARLIAHGEDVFKKTYALGAYGTYISGAGPTIMSIVSTENQKFEPEIRQYLDDLGLVNWKIYRLSIDNIGTRVVI